MRTRSASAVPTDYDSLLKLHRALDLENAALREALADLTRSERTLLSTAIEIKSEHIEFVRESTARMQGYGDQITELRLQNEMLREGHATLKRELDSMACFRPLKRGRGR
jgi:hypothetical protein